MNNKVQLIAYIDRLSGGGIRDLSALLQNRFAGLFGGVHLLPFFYPIDGADAGFDPIDHTSIDDRLGDWTDLKALANNVEVMADVIVNHVSSQSPQFQDFLQQGELSAYAGLFLTRDHVFPEGITAAELNAIYRPRPGQPFTRITLHDGSTREFWTTFTPQQIDIDVTHPQGDAYLRRILETFSSNHIRMVRLDAVGYAIKKPGSSCFMLPETFKFIDEFASYARALGIEVLVEIHSYYRKQIEIAQRVDWVYDFALPPLVLHAFAFNTARALQQWVNIRPNNALTVLDTHDGIGIIDIGAERGHADTHPGLVPPAELDQLVDIIHQNAKGESRLATGAAASNLDLYQVNCTFYDALARNDVNYLLARAIQFFLPGIPQVYYVGLLAGHNDLALLQHTHVGRDINRHYYNDAEIDAALQRPVVQRLCELIRLRNTHPAFSGRFSMLAEQENVLDLRWQQDTEFARLVIDFATHAHQLTYSSNGKIDEFDLTCNVRQP